MKIGAIETLDEEEQGVISREESGSKRLRNRSGGSSDDNDDSGGGGGNSGGGGGDRKQSDEDKEFFDELNEYSSNKFRIGTGFLILVVLMTFGGLIGAYIVISTNGVQEWKPFSLPTPIWISTAIILLSSFTFYIAHRALIKEQQDKAKNWLLATTVLGGMFIASQLVTWVVLAQKGYYLQSNPYAGFFYLFTAVHAIHLLGGIIALGYIVLRTWQKTKLQNELDRRKVYSTVVSWYWHFMDGLWLVLLVLLGFWK